MGTEKAMSVTEFKAKCLAILEHLDADGVILTKHGRPIAKVIPLTPNGNQQFIGTMKGRITVKGDLFSTGIGWDAQPRHAYRRRTTQRKPKRR